MMITSSRSATSQGYATSLSDSTWSYQYPNKPEYHRRLWIIINQFKCGLKNICSNKHCFRKEHWCAGVGWGCCRGSGSASPRAHSTYYIQLVQCRIRQLTYNPVNRPTDQNSEPVVNQLDKNIMCVYIYTYIHIHIHTMPSFDKVTSWVPGDSWCFSAASWAEVWL